MVTFHLLGGKDKNVWLCREMLRATDFPRTGWLRTAMVDRPCTFQLDAMCINATCRWVCLFLPCARVGGILVPDSIFSLLHSFIPYTPQILSNSIHTTHVFVQFHVSVPWHSAERHISLTFRSKCRTTSPFLFRSGPHHVPIFIANPYHVLHNVSIPFHITHNVSIPFHATHNVSIPFPSTASLHSTALWSVPSGPVLQHRLGSDPGRHPGRPSHDRHHDPAQQPEGGDLLDHHERRPVGDDALEELRLPAGAGTALQGVVLGVPAIFFFFFSDGGVVLVRSAWLVLVDPYLSRFYLEPC